MKSRRILWILMIPALLVVCGMTGWWWLLHTEPGARWVLEKATAASSAPLEISAVSGTLSSGLHLEKVSFEQDLTRVGAGSIDISIGAKLLPLSLDVVTFHAADVQVAVLSKREEKIIKEELAGPLSMPFPLTFGDIRITGIEFLWPGADTPLRLDSLEAAGSLFDKLMLDRLDITLADDRLSLQGQAALVPPHIIAVEFQTSGRLELTGRLSGDLNSAELVLDIANPESHITGRLTQLLKRPGWDLEVSAPLFQWPLADPDPSAKLTGIQAHSTGQWPLFDLDLVADLVARGLEPARLSLTGSGSEKDFTARSLTVEGPGLSMEATGDIAWDSALRLSAATTLRRLDPRLWLTDWPEGHPVSGELGLDWGGEALTIRNFQLAIANTASSASGSGTVSLESGVVDLAMNWSRLEWPVGSAAPAFASRKGEIQLSGLPENWKLEGFADVRSGDFPEGQLRLTGNGDTESLNVLIQQGKVLGGTISGKAFFNWTGAQPFEASLSAEQIDITSVFPGYPGVLNTRFTAKGEINPFQLEVNLRKLDGTIRGYPMTGQGRFHIRQERFFADDLRLGSGPSTLRLHGSLYEPGGIDFSTNIDSLAQFSADLGGTLIAEGNVSLHPASPRISASLSGRDLTIGDVTIEQVETRQASAPGQGREIVLSGLVFGHRPIELMTLRFGGQRPLEALSARALMGGTDINLELQGSVSDWSKPLDSGWKGTLSALRIDHLGQFFLALDRPASLAWTPPGFSLEPACLSGTGDARLCLSSSRDASDDFNVSAELAAIPVSLIEVLTDTGLKFNQELSGTLDWSQSKSEGSRGAARFEISPGVVQVAEDDEVLLKTGAGRFGFELADEVLQNGNLELALPGTGEIDVNFSIPDFSLGSDSPVFGKIRVDFRDLSAFAPLLPLFDSISGVLDVNLDMSGVISDPDFIGKASLTDGQFSNRASGFSFSEINLSGDVNDLDRTELKGTFRAGEGSGSLSSTILFEDAFSPVVQLTLKGKSLTVVDVPDLKVIADPDVVLTWRKDMLELGGRLLIPTAWLSPSYLPQHSIRQSDDVVIVAGELAVPEEDSLRQNPLRIRGSLEVELGKKAEIVLDMAKVRIFGTTRFTWNDDLIPVANGNFDIRGDVQAYGQSLKVTQGRISFPDIPADNPHLNIRAERSIYGNSQIQKAGLMVVGTLKRPIIEAYTVPMTNKDRAQTLLVTGSDFNYEQGVGAVAVGAYVLPKLYISYGIGVFEEGNVISARYDLGNNFGVKVTSGQKDTGADLNYTIEH